MAMDHYDMDPDFAKVLKAGNYVSPAPPYIIRL